MTWQIRGEVDDVCLFFFHGEQHVRTENQVDLPYISVQKKKMLNRYVDTPTTSLMNEKKSESDGQIRNKKKGIIPDYLSTRNTRLSSWHRRRPLIQLWMNKASSAVAADNAIAS